MRVLWLAMVIGLGTGCSGITRPDAWQREAGIIEPELSSVQLLVLPQQVFAGTPFTVTVNTLSPDSCVRRGDTTVEVTGLTARIAPRDLVAHEPAGCRDIFSVLRHEVTVTFPAAGTARIVVVGRSLAGEPVEFEATLTVSDPGTAF